MKTIASDITGRTSETVQELGLYESDCCMQELIFDRNDCFSRCPRCEGRCEWVLVENLMTIKDFEMGDPTDWLDVDYASADADAQTDPAADPEETPVHALIA